MKIAVLSDTRLPTSADEPGHGLGKIMLAIAEGLKARGHDVTLFAGAGSKFDGKLVIKADERDFLNAVFSHYDAILDGGHRHELGKQQPHLPVMNLSHDREASPGANAVFPSKAHRAWHGYHEQNGKVIYNGVKVNAIPDQPRPGTYFGYLSMFHSPKGPLMAAEAARLAGVELLMAGPTPPAPPPGVRYVGPLWGVDKLNFFAGAKALLFPASIEAGPVTILEAQSVGCPVIVSAFGAARENMQPGVTGYACEDTLQMAEAIGQVDAINRLNCWDFINKERSESRMVDQYESMLERVAAGERW